MEEFVKFLQAWKELVGAVIGVFGSLWVAVIVAASARRAEERGAAVMLVADLFGVCSSVDTIKQMAREKGVKVEDLNYFMVEKLTHIRPVLSPLFDSSFLRVVNCDKSLGSYLSLFQGLMRSVEPVYLRLADDLYLIAKGQKPDRGIELINADVATVCNAYIKAADYAEFAIYFLERAVISRSPKLYKLRRRIFRNEKEKKAEHVLKNLYGF